jgi:chemotaxis protein methyltransferase CheR
MSSLRSAAGVNEMNSGLVPGEFLLTQRDFREIAVMIHADAGIALPQSKAAHVYSRLAKRLRALGLSNFRDYCRLVATSGGLDERQKMLAALTTNVTRFFREPHHFHHLENKILPPLIKAARRGERLRLWSAACSADRSPIRSLLPCSRSCRMPPNMTSRCLPQTSILRCSRQDGEGLIPRTMLPRCRRNCARNGSCP